MSFQLQTVAENFLVSNKIKASDNTRMIEIDNNTLVEPPTPGTWLYLMGSSADELRTKIGMTKHDPMKRFSVLRCGDPYLFLHAAFYLPSSCLLQAADFEKGLHRAFTPARIPFHNDGLSEWFRIGYERAESDCQSFIENQFPDQSRFVHPFSIDAYHSGVDIIKAYDSDLRLLFGPPTPLDGSGLPW